MDDKPLVSYPVDVVMAREPPSKLTTLLDHLQEVRPPGHLIAQKQGPSDLRGADGPRGFCYQGFARKTLFSCLSFTCIRHYFPRRGRQTETAQCASRESHPSEDLSELPP